MKIVAMLVVCGFASLGCRRAEPGGAAEKKPAAPSSTAQIIEDLTGKTDIKAGRRARQTIEKVSAEERKNLDEILE